MVPLSAVVIAVLLAPSHSIGFWRDIVQQRYAPPDGADVPLESPDVVEIR